MKSDHDSFLAYYLTERDEGALKFKDTRNSVLPYEVPEDEEVSTIFLELTPGLTFNSSFRQRSSSSFVIMRQ